MENKDLLRLSRQILRVAEKSATIETAAIAQQSSEDVVGVFILNGTDTGILSQHIYDKASEMRNKGAQKVEVQYSTVYVPPIPNVSGNSSIVHSVLLIGRKYANTSVK